MNFPVAYIDAWSDDLLDEPLTALAATLEDAFKALNKGNTTISTMLGNVINNAGEVGKIAAIGGLKKVIAGLIGAAATESMSGVLDGDVSFNEKTEDFLSDEAKEAGALAVETTEKAVKAIAARPYMRDRITSFRQGKQALSDLKESLSSLVENVGEGKRPPVIIIVDELDRCRPTYAVKLLEEIKHAFDVHGLVFILGMNGEQLGYSLSGAYGPGFNGPAYLSRFISRRYRLENVDLTPLLKSLCARVGFDNSMFVYHSPPSGEVSIAEFIGLYMKAFDLKARDAFQVIDIIQTCVGIAKGIPIWLGLLLPKIMKKISLERISSDNVSEIHGSYDFGLMPNGASEVVNPKDYESILERYARYSTNDLHRTARGSESMWFLAVEMLQFRQSLRSKAEEDAAGMPKTYDKLISQIGRFSNPELTADSTVDGRI